MANGKVADSVNSGQAADSKIRDRMAPGRNHEERLVIRSWPKLICAYPIAAMGMLYACLMWLWPNSPGLHAFCGQTFFGLMLLIAIVMLLDCRGWHIVTVGLAALCAVLMFWLLSLYLPLVQAVSWLWSQVDLDATPQVYLFFSLGYLILMGCATIVNRFEYWEVTPNELLHNYGPMSDLLRYPAANVKIEKEIPDLFEYLLARSGRLIIYPNNERKAIILDNVLNVNAVEEQIKHLLGALEVRVDRD